MRTEVIHAVTPPGDRCPNCSQDNPSAVLVGDAAQRNSGDHFAGSSSSSRLRRTRRRNRSVPNPRMTSQFKATTPYGVPLWHCWLLDIVTYPVYMNGHLKVGVAACY